jgi:Ca2+-binding EF-hand superfamily protein
MAQRIAKIMRADANRDGVITYEELQSPLESDKAGSRNRDTFQARSLLDADPNKDGRLTADEVTKLAEETFRRHDTDGNNELSKEEIIALLRATQGGPGR